MIVGVDEIARIEDELTQLARQGNAASLSRPGRASVALSRLGACAFTRPRGEAGSEALLNTDNFLVEATTVANEDALVLALAHGNYKDPGCAFASAVAVCEVHAELAKPLLGPADVPQALRRALLNANTRIQGLARSDVSGRGIGTVGGARTDLRGIAAVVTRQETVIAHVGENRALLLRDGRLRQLVVPHTFWFSQGHERRARMGTTEAAVAQDVPVRILGMSDAIAIDVLRSPGAPGDRLLIGNGGFRVVREEPALAWGAPPEALLDALVRVSAERARWVPPTVIVADVYTS